MIDTAVEFAHNRGALIAALCYFWIDAIQRADSAGILAFVNPLWIFLNVLPEPSLSISLRISMSQSDWTHTLPVYTDTNDLSLAPALPQPSTHGTNSICTQYQDRLLDHPVKQSVTKATGGAGDIHILTRSRS